jgi:putative membrane protein
MERRLQKINESLRYFCSPSSEGVAMSMTRSVALFMLVTAVAACAKKEASRAADTTRVDTTSAAPAMGPGAAADTGAAATTASAAPMTDPNIVFILHAANSADSARGKLAESKGTSPEVKSFGKLMVGEHHALNQQGDALAKKLNVTPVAPANDQSEAQARMEMDSLTALAKGAAWDKAYIAYEIGYHQAVKDIATKALAQAQNAELKALITKAAPVIQAHLDKAQAIQTKLGS